MAPLAALKPAVEELKQELQLTDEQVARVQEFVIGQIGRVSAAVENFGGISFDSILDLMVEARATRDEFIPAMSSVLTEEQEAKLAKLPKAHEIYVAAVAGWLTEAQLEKLRDRLALEDNQLPQVRAALLAGFRDASTIVEGLMREADDHSMREIVLDAVLDLRTAQRTAEREIQRLLSDEQRARLESYREESAKKSRAKGAA
jgi:hypothetical protein